MKIVTVVGARPQFIKAAIVSKQLAALPEMEEVLVHTGQHYDQKMSGIFFEQLGIPTPRYQLQIGSANHGAQTGAMLARVEELLLIERPDVMLVYGDTNSTLAGGLAASKLHIPVIHIEAGLRSFNRGMPEEINRVLVDHLSAQLFCSTEAAVENLRSEGIVHGVSLVGDVMLDAVRHFSQEIDEREFGPHRFGLQPDGYMLATCHRAENTDCEERLAGIVRGICELAKNSPVLFPMHPRTLKKLASLGISTLPGVKIIEPISYLEMICLTRNASLVLTDSGGVQKEAFFLGVPCVTMRDESEWVETVELGVNRLAGANAEKIVAEAKVMLGRKGTLPDAGPWYGGGQASARIAQQIEAQFTQPAAA